MAGRSSDRVYRILRSEILDGDLTPGTVLGEVEQAARLGVSRTPLREALGRLASDGLIAPSRGRGLVVTEVSISQVRELFEVRRALEVEAARLAATRRDPGQFEALRAEFAHVDETIDPAGGSQHTYYELAGRLDAAVDAATGNSYLQALLHNLRTHIARVRRISHDNPDRLRDAAREHLTIIEAILDGEPDIAAHAMQVHIHRSLANILESAADGGRAANHPPAAGYGRNGGAGIVGTAHGAA